LAQLTSSKSAAELPESTSQGIDPCSPRRRAMLSPVYVSETKAKLASTPTGSRLLDATKLHAPLTSPLSIELGAGRTEFVELPSEGATLELMSGPPGRLAPWRSPSG